MLRSVAFVMAVLLVGGANEEPFLQLFAGEAARVIAVTLVDEYSPSREQYPASVMQSATYLSAACRGSVLAANDWDAAVRQRYVDLVARLTSPRVVRALHNRLARQVLSEMVSYAREESRYRQPYSDAQIIEMLETYLEALDEAKPVLRAAIRADTKVALQAIERYHHEGDDKAARELMALVEKAGGTTGNSEPYEIIGNLGWALRQVDRGGAVMGRTYLDLINRSQKLTRAEIVRVKKHLAENPPPPTPTERLFAAAKGGDFEAARKALRDGADANATVGDATLLLTACRDNNVALARALLEHGANPLVRGDGSSPIEHAISAGAYRLLTRMVSAGAATKWAVRNATDPICNNSSCGSLPSGDVRLGESTVALTVKRACGGGDAAACTALGAIYLNGWGVSQNHDVAVRMTRRGCDGGDMAGCVWLGHLLLISAGNPRDPIAAMDLYLRACAANNADGCASAGNRYLFSIDVLRDEKKGAELIDKACRLGSEAACREQERE